MAADPINTPTYAEFFCGGGMVRAALRDTWDCGLANDIDPMKCDVYQRNWGGDGFHAGDVAQMPDALLQRSFDMFWASSPCQDFSLAGKGAGLAGARSGVYSSWINKISPAINAGFAPRVIAFENVVGLVTRNNGADFVHVLRTLIRLGYRVGAFEIDARDFLPQSRPRIFVIALRQDVVPRGLVRAGPDDHYHSARLTRFVAQAPREIQRAWRWWSLPHPPTRQAELDDILEPDMGGDWFAASEVRNLLSMMSEPSAGRVRDAKAQGTRAIGMLYRRGRPNADGGTRQRAEVRFDGLAGCLRTPAGGSSRQTVMVVDKGRVKARLLSAREAMRLMGLADSYITPNRYNDAYKVAGDGVAVPIVRHLDEHLLRPMLALPLQRAVA